jgi:multimeric flavodoxin WrbA
MKNILVITGSSRKNGNSELMAKAFIEGAKESGHNVSLFEAGKKNLLTCIGCRTCFSKGQACSFSDDFNEIVPFLENADVIVSCTPLYWFTFSSKIKMVIDKLYSFIIGKRELKIKEAVLMVCANTQDTRNFDGIIKTFELILRHEKWENAGILTVPNVNKVGDIKSTDGLKKAEEMGKRM